MYERETLLYIPATFDPDYHYPLIGGQHLM